MIGKIRFAILFFVIVSTLNVDAQESMMPEISYPYLEKLTALAKLNYPKMKMNNDKVASAKTGVKKAKMGWYNFLNMSYLYSPTNTTTLVNPSSAGGYQFGAYFNLGNLLTNGPTVKMAKQELDIANDNLAEYNLNIEQEVRVRYFTYIKYLTVLKIRVQSTEDIESSMKQVKYKFERGEESLDNYNKGIVVFYNALQNKIEAEGNLLIAKGSLEEIIGVKLEEVK